MKWVEMEIGIVVGFHILRLLGGGGRLRAWNSLHVVWGIGEGE